MSMQNCVLVCSAGNDSRCSDSVWIGGSILSCLIFFADVDLKGRVQCGVCTFPCKSFHFLEFDPVSKGHIFCMYCADLDLGDQLEVESYGRRCIVRPAAQFSWRSESKTKLGERQNNSSRLSENEGDRTRGDCREWLVLKGCRLRIQAR